jgi:Spy/CpxP family protein refolding chaperone
MSGPQRLFRGLDLTQEQRDQLRVLAEERRQQDEPEATRLRELNDALHAELFADVPDQGTIEQLKIDLNQAHRQALDARVAAQLKLAQVLTPEQRQQVREARNQPRTRGRFGPRGAGGW